MAVQGLLEAHLHCEVAVFAGLEGSGPVAFFNLRLGRRPSRRTSAMNCKRTAISAVLAAVLAAVPFSAAKAEPPYFAFPLFWPFITIGAIVETAAAVATAPFRPFCPPCYYGPPPAPYY